MGGESDDRHGQQKKANTQGIRALGNVCFRALDEREREKDMKKVPGIDGGEVSCQARGAGGALG